MAPTNKPMAARPPQKAIPGRPFKVSDEITIIPQGKNTQANKPKVWFIKIHNFKITAFTKLQNLIFHKIHIFQTSNSW